MPIRIDAETIAGLTGTIYEAAFNQERWQDVVERLRLVLGGSRSCIMRIGSHGLSAVTTTLDEELGSTRALEAHRRDPLSLAVMRYPIGLPYRRTEVAGPEFMRRELFNEWYLPRDMIDGVAANLVIAGDTLWILDVHRGSNQDRFDDSEIAIIRALLPHVLRAGELGMEARTGSILLGAAPGQLPNPLFIVDGEGFLFRANPAGEAMLSAPAMPVRLRNGQLSLSDASAATALRQLLRDVCTLLDGALPGSGGTFFLNSAGRTQDEAPKRFTATVAPATGEEVFGMSHRPLAVIMVREVILTVPDGFADRIARLFALSPSEAAIAASLASGHSLQEAAADRAVTVKTARTYLERVFRKTGTTRQNQLVALLKTTQPAMGAATWRGMPADRQ